MEENVVDIVIGFFSTIYNFMNVPLHWGKYTFTLWEALITSVVFGIVGYMVGSWLNANKDD